jgi:hypothetical protein
MLEKAIREGLSKKQALVKYSKNRYHINPFAYPVREVVHYLTT